MIYAMAGMWLTLYLKFEQGYSFYMRLVRVTAFVLIVLFPTTFQPTTSYLAHGLGFVFGVMAACGLIFVPSIRDRVKLDPVPEEKVMAPKESQEPPGFVQ
jgi:hypothetical protein